MTAPYAVKCLILLTLRKQSWRSGNSPTGILNKISMKSERIVIHDSAPITTSEMPTRYFVTELHHEYPPRSPLGFCKYAEANVLSTAKISSYCFCSLWSHSLQNRLIFISRICWVFYPNQSWCSNLIFASKFLCIISSTQKWILICHKALNTLVKKR